MDPGKSGGRRVAASRDAGVGISRHAAAALLAAAWARGYKA